MNSVFTEANGLITPNALAAGPFQNLQGGAAAGIMASAAIANTPAEFTPVSQRTEFIRSTPLKPFRIVVSPVREGRSVRVCDVEIQDENSGTISARSTLTFYAPQEVKALQPCTPSPWGGQLSPTELEALPPMPRPADGSIEWMLNATEIRTKFDGTWWFRWQTVFDAHHGDHWFSLLQGPADWVGGFIRPGFPAPSKVNVWPNTDLTVHIDRPFTGEWIGLRPQGHYRRSGFGLGYSELLDQHGSIGRVAANVLSPTSH